MWFLLVIAGFVLFSLGFWGLLNEAGGTHYFTGEPIDHRCRYCGKPSHKLPGCPQQRKDEANKSKMTCSYCGLHTHSSMECYRYKARKVK